MREFIKIMNSTSLDEIGLSKSLKRFKSESMYSYKRRIERAAYEPPNYSFESMSTYSNLVLGQHEKKILKIQPTTAGTFPRIVVDCCFVKLYEADLDGNEQLLDSWNYIEDVKYMRDLIPLLNAHSILTATETLEEDISFLEVKNLKIQDSLMRSERESLVQKPINRLGNRNIVDFVSDDAIAFMNEVASPELLVRSGDYYFDKTEGKIISYTNPTGTISYQYYRNEYFLVWQPIKVWLLNDESVESRIKDNKLINGNLERAVLNREGCDLINQSLKIQPINWGE